MDRSVYKTHLLHSEDGAPGQPEKKCFRIWFWCERFDAVVCDAENDKEAERWFFDLFQRHNQHALSRLVVRIDDLGVVNDDQPVQELSEAEFLATAREVKAVHCAREKKGQLDQRDSNTGQRETLNESPTPNGTPGISEIRCYRIWYRSWDLDDLECEAGNENKAAKWFHQWCQRNDDEITTHALEGIVEVDVEAMKDRQAMLTRDKESKSGDDFFAALARLKKSQEKQT